VKKKDRQNVKLAPISECFRLGLAKRIPTLSHHWLTTRPWGTYCLAVGLLKPRARRQLSESWALWWTVACRPTKRSPRHVTMAPKLGPSAERTVETWRSTVTTNRFVNR